MKKIKKLFILTFSLILFIGCSSINIKEKETTFANSGTEIITTNEISIEEVSNDKLPPNMSNSINGLKSNRGYLVYSHEGDNYIAVFSGKRNTGGYSIKVISIEDKEGQTNIIVEEKAPQQGDMVTQVITYPYTVIKVKRISSDFVLKTTKDEILEKVMKEGQIY
jgi:hypothetical protein